MQTLSTASRLAKFNMSRAAAIAGVTRKVVVKWVKNFGCPLANEAEFRRWLETSRPKPKAKRPDFKPRTAEDDSRGGVIYALIDPRPEKKEQIRYIGKSEDFGKRKQDYARDLKRDRAHSPPLFYWFRKLKRLGLRPKFRILDECLFGLNALECQWIERGRKKGWHLLNCKGGGLGGRWTEETKKRQSERGKAVWERPGYRETWEQSHAIRWGFASTSEWKADQHFRIQGRAINRCIQLWRQRHPKPKHRTARGNLRQYPVVPLAVGKTAFIPLTQGRWAKIDRSDWDNAMKRKWWAQLHNGKVRAKTSGPKDAKGNHTTILLHRYLLDGVAERIDFANRDPLDCRRANLLIGHRPNPAKPAGASHLQSTLRGVEARLQSLPTNEALRAVAMGLRRRLSAYEALIA